MKKNSSLKLYVLILAILTSCLNDIKESGSDTSTNYCKPSNLSLTQKDECVHLIWECLDGEISQFVIKRESNYKNALTDSISFTTNKTEYVDCSIFTGLTYQYFVNLLNDPNTISKEINTKSVRDFSVLFPYKGYTGNRFEVELNYIPLATNPYDMSELNIRAEIIRPDGTKEEATGFFMTEYQIDKDESGRESFTRLNDKIKLRYLPNQIGTYIFKFVIEDGTKRVNSYYYAFDVERGKKREYVRISEKNPQYFETENKEYFFPIGFNIGWSTGGRGLYEYIDYMDKMAENNNNLFRMWMIKWSNALEWTRYNGSGDYNGLMRYAQDNAARIDRILSYAEKMGLKLILTFGSYLEFSEGGYWNEGSWKENPYNTLNGGMCKTPEEFFTNEEAKRIYKNRLKYISARWGYSDSIFAYEFFNETNAPYEWVSEMSNYLRKMDCSRHLISTTYGDDKIFGLKNVDFTMAHLYGNPPNLIKYYPERINEITSQFTTKYKKPFLLAEFGIDWSKSDYEYDKEGNAINLHNGIFAAISSGSAGTAMLWWWDSYIDRLNLYQILSPVRIIIDKFGDFDGVSPIKTNASNGITAYGIGSNKKVLIWIQNKESNWYNAYNKTEFVPVDVEISTNGLEMNCEASISIFNPWTSEIINNYIERVNNDISYTHKGLKRDIILIAKCN